MKRRAAYSIILLFAILAFNGNAEVSAECVAPDCVSGNGCEISIVRGNDGEAPLVVTADNNSALPYSLYAGECATFPCTVFAYNINAECNYSHINQALVNPNLVCGENNTFELLYWDPEDATYNEPGAGDASSKWYFGDESTRVFTWNSNLPTNQKGFYFITTNNVSIGGRPVFIDAKKDTFGTLLAPACQDEAPDVLETGFIGSIGQNSIVIQVTTSKLTREIRKIVIEDTECEVTGNPCREIITPGHPNWANLKPWNDIFVCKPESDGQTSDHPATIDEKLYYCFYPSKPGAIDGHTLLKFEGSNPLCDYYYYGYRYSLTGYPPTCP